MLKTIALITLGIILIWIFTKKESTATPPPSPPPPPPVIYEHVLSVDADCAVACSNVPGTTIVYSDSPTVNSGITLYQNEELTLPVDNNCFAQAVEQTGGAFLNVNYQVTNGIGEITNSQFCN